jgi:hypothetical protein
MDKRLEEKLEKKFGRPTEYDDEEHKVRAEYMRKWYARNRATVARHQAKPESKVKRRAYRKLPHVKAQERIRQNRRYHERKLEDADFLLERYIGQYGITADDYRAMLEAQGGHCAICPATVGREAASNRKAPDRLHVDHDHVTGKVRALLCGRCNLVIGEVDEDIERLRRMADYLERHKETQ